jgi:4-amino-4-deoxy-L-arabinose transferase-like glycosyltransferase
MKLEVISREVRGTPAAGSASMNGDREAAMASGPVSLPVLILLSAIGFLLSYMASWRGIALSPDSVSYISAAKSLLAGDGFMHYDGKPFVLWPPLYPMLLAGLSALGLAVLDAARLLNALFFAGIVFLSGLWLRRTLESRPQVVAGLALILLSPALRDVGSYAWSEPLFIILSLLALYCLGRYTRLGTPRMLLAAALFTAGAILTRYIGVTLAATGVLLLLARRPSSPVRGLRDATVYGVISGLPFLLWIGRNYAVSSTLMGPRAPSEESMPLHGYRTLRTFVQWLTTVDRAPVWLVVGVSAVAVLTVGVGVRALFRRWGQMATERREPVVASIPFLLFAVVYSIFLLFSATSTAFDHIDTRLLSPVYVPLVLGLLPAVYVLRVSLDRGRRPKYMAVALIVGMVCWSALATWDLGLRVTATDGGGLNYNARRWRDSDLMEFLRDHTFTGVIYSNDPASLYFHTGLSARMSPRKHEYRQPSNATDDLAELSMGLRSSDRTFLVWTTLHEWDYLYTLDELKAVFDLHLMAKLSDGMVYRIQ